MKSTFERYVEKIVSQTECTKEVKEDMYEEIMIHLELSKGELMKEGMCEKDAELKAIELFGSEGEIGGQIQQSIFPYRKEFMLTLSILSFIFSISVYLLSLFTEGDAYIEWLTFSMFVNSVLLFIALSQVARFNRRIWMNGILITHILTYLYGYAIVSSLEHSAHLPLAILDWMIILVALILIYQTTIYEVQFHGEFVKETKTLHRINLVSGVIIIGFTLFFLWGGLVLFGGPHPFMLLMTVPLVLWILFYFGQMKLLKKHKRIAFTLAIVSILLEVLILLYFFFPLK